MNESMIPSERKEAFFENLKLTHTTKCNYRYAINHPFLIKFIKDSFQINSIFEVTDLDKLLEIYNAVKIHPINIEKHRVCSAAIMSYIKYLNDGKKLGRRIDYQKPRPASRKKRKRRTKQI